MFSGGSTIMCAGFDAMAFWMLARDLQASWYYAAPTIYHLPSRPAGIVASRDLRIRMIANTAGGLLPSLAESLNSTFDAMYAHRHPADPSFFAAGPPVVRPSDIPWRVHHLSNRNPRHSHDARPQLAFYTYIGSFHPTPAQVYIWITSTSTHSGRLVSSVLQSL
ncbi:hypothetical protein DFH08DRAFT_836594, partial [Mycena albidolilacea]